MSERMINQFMEMVRIDSESGEEAAMMEYLLKAIPEAGGTADLDSYGNLIARFPAKGCEGVEPILLSCHADTVKPGKGIEPIIVDGIIRSKGDTILGADNKAGIAEVLEAIRIAEVMPPVEFAVSRQEEVGLLGVKNLDFSSLTAKRGFLVDNDTFETIVIGGPSYFAIDVEIAGRSAHAGMEPEKGINAIQAAAKAISALDLGRLDEETTANVGIIEGGIIRNGVPDRCKFMAECRSSDHAKAVALNDKMIATIREEVESVGAKAEITSDNLCQAVNIPESAWSVEISKKAIEKIGVDARCVFITGFTDASIYNNEGIEMAVIGTGAKDEHATTESIAVDDMGRALEMLVEILRLSALSR
jgi:tripeptide aminopeptidase